MKHLVQLGIAVVLALSFTAHFDSADARKRERDRERDRYGFYAPYFGSESDDRYRYRTERRGAYDKGARTNPPSRLERGAYSYSFD